MTTGCWGEYLDPRGRKWQEAGEDCIPCTLHQILLGSPNKGGWDGQDL